MKSNSRKMCGKGSPHLREAARLHRRAVLPSIDEGGIRLPDAKREKLLGLRKAMLGQFRSNSRGQRQGAVVCRRDICAGLSFVSGTARQAGIVPSWTCLNLQALSRRDTMGRPIGSVTGKGRSLMRCGWKSATAMIIAFCAPLRKN